VILASGAVRDSQCLHKARIYPDGRKGDAMKFLMFYTLAGDGLQKVPQLYAAHSARLDEFKARGVLSMAGPFGDPPKGAVAVFTTEEAAREFIAGDPFVQQGAVGSWEVHPWAEALAP
jgi:uncharacterized protein YciI